MMLSRFKNFILFWLMLGGAIISSSAGEIHQLIIQGDETNALAVLKKNAGLIESRDESANTPLHCAAEFKRIKTLKWLIKHKANVNAIAHDGYTPLHLTSDGEVAHLLVRDHADLKLKDNWGRTPLQRAALMQHEDVGNEILEYGGQLDLSSALWLGRREEAIKMIKKKPAAVRMVAPDADLWGNTSPLGIAAGKGDVEIVKLLLAAGAPVNAATDRPGLAPMTALCNAVWGGNYEIAELLCNAGADCNVTGGKFYPNLLDFALKDSGPNMVELLIAHGAKSGK